MAVETSKSAVLKSLIHELKKTYIIFDGQNRQWKVVEAPNDAGHGDPAIMTEYVYSGPTTTVIIAQKEINTTWDSSYDVFTI